VRACKNDWWPFATSPKLLGIAALAGAKKEERRTRPLPEARRRAAQNTTGRRSLSGARSKCCLCVTSRANGSGSSVSGRQKLDARASLQIVKLSLECHRESFNQRDHRPLNTLVQSQVNVELKLRSGGNFLRTARKDAGLTQTHVAKHFGAHASFVSKVESGERRLDVVELADFCRLSSVRLPAFLKKAG
jgi:hypothetical protein